MGGRADGLSRCLMHGEKLVCIRLLGVDRPVWLILGLDSWRIFGVLLSIGVIWVCVGVVRVHLAVDGQHRLRSGVWYWSSMQWAQTRQVQAERED